MKKINIFFIHFLIFANMCKMVLFVSFKIPFYFADYTYRKNEIRKKEKEDKKAVYSIESIPIFIINDSKESLETIALFLTLERIL